VHSEVEPSSRAQAAVSGAPARSKRLPRAVREQQMLDAAVRVFSRSGYHAASMDEIAEECAVSKPLLYLYLGSKEELFSACLRREAERLIEALASAVDPRLDPGAQLYHGLAAFFRYVADHRDSWIVLYQQARSQGGPIVAEVDDARRLVTDAVAGLVRRNTEPDPGHGDPAHADFAAAAIAHSIVGAADALADWTLDSGRAEPPETTAERLMNIFWIGLDRRMEGARYTLPPAPPAAD